jgi:hypothetical protein
MCRAVSAIFVMSILIFNAHTPVTSQTDLTNEDKKQILSKLFELELAALDGRDLVIRFSPRTDKTWLVELPGVRFQQLSYDEERQVSEYYELRDVKIRHNLVEVWLSKGNYCKKAGTVYQFRKADGKWTAKTHRFSESYTDSGRACVGCEIGSGSVYTWKNGTARAAEYKEPKGMLLTGRALAIRCRRNETKYIKCEVDMSLDFSNRGDRPIIILQPQGGSQFWQGARSLALTKADSEAGKYVYSNAAWPSFYDTKEDRLTRAVGPNESWTWTTTMQLAVAEENMCSNSVGVEIGWKEIKKLSAPLWLEVSYEMLPFNKSRSGHVTSEPIELDFQPVELK